MNYVFTRVVNGEYNRDHMFEPFLGQIQFLFELDVVGPTDPTPTSFTTLLKTRPGDLVMPDPFG